MSRWQSASCLQEPVPAMASQSDHSAWVHLHGPGVHFVPQPAKRPRNQAQMDTLLATTVDPSRLATEPQLLASESRASRDPAPPVAGT